MTSTPSPAPVPRGPGAQPPFPAAPTEGGGTRLAWGIGIAVAAVLLCCGGGLAAVVGLGVTGVQALEEQARVVVGDYLDALRQGKYEQAYGLLCDREQQATSLSRFSMRESSRPKIVSYDLGELEVDADLTMPVTQTYAGGDTDVVRYPLEQDTSTGKLEVCGRE